eukprot:EC715936.1.p1 GENE.EC715936.1~~EC715936.1.p1  ORF type:complete len:152 (+),score=20.77 EC715936.1:106-561(+)
MMHMTFYWGWDVTLLFDSWRTTTDQGGAYFGSLVAIIALAIAYQWLVAFRVERESVLVRSNSLQLKSLNGKDTSRVPMVFRHRVLVKGHLVNSLIYFVQVSIAYLLMLAVMSYNGGVFIAAMLGFAFGHFVFGLRRVVTGSEDAETGEVCH